MSKTNMEAYAERYKNWISDSFCNLYLAEIEQRSIDDN